MTYEELLAAAPAQDTDAFLDFLRKRNTVVFESDAWLIIENYKYHRPHKAWYTAFWKGDLLDDPFAEWFTDLDILWYSSWKNWEWRKKAATDQTVPGRFHLHLIEPD